MACVTLLFAILTSQRRFGLRYLLLCKDCTTAVRHCKMTEYFLKYGCTFYFPHVYFLASRFPVKRRRALADSPLQAISVEIINLHYYNS